MSKYCYVLQTFSGWVLCIQTQVPLIAGILEHNMNSSYVYAINIMGRNKLPPPLNKILFCLTSQVSKKENKQTAAIWAKENFGKGKGPKKRNNKLKNISYPFPCPLHHKVQLQNIVELEERKYFSSSSYKKYRNILEELGKATE